MTNDVNFSVSVSGGGVGGGASVTIQALAEVGPIESPMVIDDELVAPYVKGTSLIYRFEGWNGVDATANGACFGLTLSEWTARGWITGFGASAKPRIIIPQIPECDVPGAGPDNWE